MTEAMDWRLVFRDAENKELISTYSWEDPEDPPLMIGRIRSNPVGYNFIDESDQIVTGEAVNFDGEIEVRLINFRALQEDDGLSA